MKNVFYFMLFIFSICYACRQSAPKTPATGIIIKISADSTGIELRNIPSFITDNFNTDTLEQRKWKNFFAIYEEPNDPELRDIQPPVKGTYSVKNDLITFIPDSSFKKGQKYFAMCYAKKMLLEPQNLLKSRKILSTGGFIEYKFRF